MNTNFYSVFDILSSVFHKPFTELNHATAKRAFSTSVTSIPHKNDLVLYYLGSFDDNTGYLTSKENPEKIITGLEVRLPDLSDSDDVQSLLASLETQNI